MVPDWVAQRGMLTETLAALAPGLTTWMLSPAKPGLLMRSNQLKYWTSGAGLYVKAPAAVAELPLGLVTVTSTLPTPGGAVAVSTLLLTKATLEAGLAPNLTVAPGRKPCPVTVTVCPPENAPEVGRTDRICAAGGGPKVASIMYQSDPLPRVNPACCGPAAPERMSSRSEEVLPL